MRHVRTAATAVAGGVALLFLMAWLDAPPQPMRPLEHDRTSNYCHSRYGENAAQVQRDGTTECRTKRNHLIEKVKS